MDTAKKDEITLKIISGFIASKCTLEEAFEILAYARKLIESNTDVCAKYVNGERQMFKNKALPLVKEVREVKSIAEASELLDTQEWICVLIKNPEAKEPRFVLGKVS